jgi:hypothetical protein
MSIMEKILKNKNSLKIKYILIVTSIHLINRKYKIAPTTGGNTKKKILSLSSQRMKYQYNQFNTLERWSKPGRKLVIVNSACIKQFLLFLTLFYVFLILICYLM